jgi:hypothetical protein
MDYTKCMHCKNISDNDSNLYMDCYKCGDAESFIESLHDTDKILNNNYLYALFSFFFGIMLICCNNFIDQFSLGWWILTAKGSALILLCLLLLYSELLNVE